MDCGPRVAPVGETACAVCNIGDSHNNDLDSIAETSSLPYFETL